MTARRAGNGGTHGSRPTGCGGHPGRAGSSAPTRQNRNRAKRDVEDAVPYTLCHCEERSDAAIRSPQPKETDSHTSDIGHWFGMTARRAVGSAGHMGPAIRGAAVIQGGQRRPPLQSKTGTVRNGTACPTNRRGAARTAKFRNFFFPLSASAGLRRLYSDDTGRPPVL